MAEIEVSRLTKGEAAYITKRLRKPDLVEIELSSALSPRRAVELTLAMSISSLVVRVDGSMVCMFGIARKGLLSDVVQPWLLGTPLLDEQGTGFLRGTRAWMRETRRDHPRMENWAHAENHVSLSWLDWLGFDMDEPKPYGWADAPFVRFSLGMK